jgi:hypothetical protein
MHSNPLSIPEAVLSIIENVACRLAERWQGRITPPHLMPYVPLCLEVLRACLDDMVDDESVLAVPGEMGAVYQFSAYRDLPVQSGALSMEVCVACGTELLAQTPGVLCPGCTAVLHKEGERASRLHGWAPQARLEHALLYAATQQGGGPVSVATLASRSHTRMRVVREALEKLTLAGNIRQEVDVNTGAMVYTFPPMAYPRALYQTNSAVLQSWSKEASGGFWRRGPAWLYVIGGVVLLGSLASWYFTPVPPLSRPLPHSALVPLPARPEPPSAPAASATSSPPYGKAYHAEAIQRATPVPVAIRQSGFTPVVMQVAVSWNTSTPLSPLAPSRIHKEPVYQGSSQRYGTLRLGTQKDSLYDFVFDLISGPHPVVYFDANQNGNLTDDGKPLTNQGSGIFATTIHLPFRRLVRDAPFPGDFTLWFFTNDSMWPRGAVAHYSRTQLKGTVYVDGHAYMAYIADAGENDTDLTNDGISVDVNGDGEINRQQEFFPPGQVAHIHGKEYVFVITW